MTSWLRKLISKNKPITSYYIVAEGVRIALLRSPVLEDMFWISFEIVPYSEPADPQIYDDEFWIYGNWEIYEEISNIPVPNVIASSTGIDRLTGRIKFRGVH